MKGWEGEGKDDLTHPVANSWLRHWDRGTRHITSPTYTSPTFWPLRHVLCNEYDRSACSEQAAARFQASHRDFPPASCCGMPCISLAPLAASI